MSSTSPNDERLIGSIKCCSIPFIIHDIDDQLVKRCGRYDEAIRSRVGCSSLPHLAADQQKEQQQQQQVNPAASTTNDTNISNNIHADSSSIIVFKLLATGCSGSSQLYRIAISASSASPTDAPNTRGKEYVRARYFPFDFSALFYQSKSLLTLMVMDDAGRDTCSNNDDLDKKSVSHNSCDGNGLLTATPSQRFLCGKYRSSKHHPTTTFTADTCNEIANGGYTGNEIIRTIDVDVMTTHRLLKPPIFEQVGGGGGSSSGEKSCGNASVSGTSEQSDNDGHTFARILMTNNWEALLGALFPLSIAGKRRVCRALLENAHRTEIGTADHSFVSSAKARNESEEEPNSVVEGRQVGALNEETDLELGAGREKEKLHTDPSPLPFSFLSPSGWKALRYDSHITDRFSYSYAAWLTFYGWRLHDEATGEVDRHASWRSRYHEMKLDHNHPQGQTSAAMKRMYYLSLTVVLQCLLELKLFPLAARLLLFMVEEFTAGRLRWLLEPRDDWFACGFADFGENRGTKMICRFCGRLEQESRSLFCPHLISLCFLDDESEEDDDCDGENLDSNGTLAAKSGSESDNGNEEQQQHQRRRASSQKSPLKLGEGIIKPLLLVSSPSSSSSSSLSLVSLFDDVWYPMVKHYNYAEGNCYDGNGDLRRLAKARAAVDATDSE